MPPASVVLDRNMRGGLPPDWTGQGRGQVAQSRGPSPGPHVGGRECPGQSWCHCLPCLQLPGTVWTDAGTRRAHSPEGSGTG